MISLIALFTILLQAVVGVSARQISGYVGESAILPSGINISIDSFDLEWSIFDNKTWIATYRSPTLNVERFWRYKGRLSLNVSTGDLEIRNLTGKDAMEYTVVFLPKKGREQIGKVRLTVLQRPRKPIIKKQVSVLKGKDCVMGLECSSEEEDVVLSWGPNISPKLWITGSPNKSSDLLATFNSKSEVTFNCTASNNVGNATESLTTRCHAIPSKNTAGSAFGWVILGLLIGAVLAYIFRVEIEKTLKCIKGKLWTCTTSLSSAI